MNHWLSGPSGEWPGFLFKFFRNGNITTLYHISEKKQENEKTILKTAHSTHSNHSNQPFIGSFLSVLLYFECPQNTQTGKNLDQIIIPFLLLLEFRKQWLEKKSSLAASSIIQTVLPLFWLDNYLIQNFVCIVATKSPWIAAECVSVLSAMIFFKFCYCDLLKV